jgi:hypothetical protein
MITTPDLLRILELIPADSLEEQQQHRLTGWMIYLKERINAPAQEHWVECVLEILRISKH